MNISVNMCTTVLEAFFFRLFFQFVYLIPVLLCNCLLMYFLLVVLFLFHFYFLFIVVLLICNICISPNHGGNKDIYTCI